MIDDTPSNRMYTVQATLSFMYWMGRLDFSMEQSARLALHLSMIDDKFLNIRQYCQEVYTVDIPNIRLYIKETDRWTLLCIGDGQTIVPLLTFLWGHNVIHNACDTVSIDYVMPPIDELEEIAREE